MPKIVLKNVTKRFGKFVAVDNLNLEIDDRSFITLLGPSGCGKTTTLRMIAGLETPTEGEITINDRIVFSSEKGIDIAASKRDVGFLFQNYALWPHMTVTKNIAFGLENLKWPKDKIQARVDELLKMLRIEEFKDRYPAELSGGQQQRVAIARTLATGPKVLFMDEPLSNLDAKLRVQMRIEISKLHQRLETTIIYVTHDQTEALTLGTRIVVMKDGVIQQVDTPIDLYSKPKNLFVAGFIGSPQMNFIDSKVVKSGSDVMLMFGSHSIKLPENKAKVLIEQGYENKTVVLGIRPEDIKDEEIFINSSPDGVIEATIKVYEMLGAEVFLYFSIDQFELTVRVNPRTNARPGDTIKLAFDLSKIHIFDKETEKTICN